MKLYGAIGALPGFAIGGVTGFFAAWIVIELLAQYTPVIARSEPVFILVWGLHVLLATAVFGLAWALLRRFEIFLESEESRSDPL